MAIPRVFKGAPKRRRKPKDLQVERGAQTEFSPSERADERVRSRKQKRSLAEGLVELAASVPPGQGRITRAISTGVSGAAIGATIGEAIGGRKRRKRRKRKRESE
jgi:hypothetical protein